MTLPVMPDDESSEYLVTQVIADYLANLRAPILDGILYPSVQDGSSGNVVLFHKSARVQELDIPGGAEVSARDAPWNPDDGGPEYAVDWRDPEMSEEKAALEKAERQLQQGDDPRLITLELNTTVSRPSDRKDEADRSLAGRLLPAESARGLYW